MLSQKAIAKLAKLAKLTPEALTAEITATDERNLDAVPEDLTSLTAQELTDRDTNKKKEGETIGEEKGKEIALKTVKKKLDIKDDTKDPEKIAELALAKITSGDETLKEQVKLLQKDVSEQKKSAGEWKEKYEAVNGDVELLSLLPSERSEALETAEHLSIVKANLQFTPEGVKYKGQVLREEGSQNAMDKASAIKHFYGQRKGLLKEEKPEGGGGDGGRGGSDSKAGLKKFGTTSEARKSWESANPGQKWGSEASQEYLRGVLKENPDIKQDDFGE